MKITRGFKYRLTPTEQQKYKLLQHGGNARFVWNLFLSHNIDRYNKIDHRRDQLVKLGVENE